LADKYKTPGTSIFSTGEARKTIKKNTIKITVVHREKIAATCSVPPHWWGLEPQIETYIFTNVCGLRSFPFKPTGRLFGQNYALAALDPLTKIQSIDFRGNNTYRLWSTDFLRATAATAVHSVS